jgi:hypothetical protein
MINRYNTRINREIIFFPFYIISYKLGITDLRGESKGPAGKWVVICFDFVRYL